MSGIVHFKFKSSNSYDSVSFDGAFVSVAELKTLIAEKKGLSKDATSELLLSDPRTQAEYNDDTALVPKSSSVLVRRVPASQPVLQSYTQQSLQQPAVPVHSEQQVSTVPQAGEDEFGGELYIEQKDEDEALAQMLAQTGQQWEKEVRAGMGRGRGRGRHFLGRGFGREGFGREGRGRESRVGPPPGTLPRGYICYRCGQQGHHIADCPTNADPDFKRIRPAVGVPMVMLARNQEGGLLLPDGQTGSLQPNEDAFMKEMVGAPTLQKPSEATATSQPEGASTSQAGLPAASQPVLATSSAAALPAATTSQAAPAPTGPDSKALVVLSVAEPTLAGDSELFPPSFPGEFSNPAAMMFPQPGGMPPWDMHVGMGGLPGMLPPMPFGGPPPFGGFGMPADKPFQDAPLSKEDFQRLQEELRRKQERSSRQRKERSRSGSRRRTGRDRRRSSSSRRRHHKRSRDRSRDKAPPRKIDLILRKDLEAGAGKSDSSGRRPKRSRRDPLPEASPSPREKRASKRSSKQDVHAAAASADPAPAARAPAAAAAGNGFAEFGDTLWPGEEFNTALLAEAAKGRPAAADKDGPALETGGNTAPSSFSVPELLDEPAPFQTSSDVGDLREYIQARKRSSTGTTGLNSRLLRGVGSRWQPEKPADATVGAAVAPALGSNLPLATAADDSQASAPQDSRERAPLAGAAREKQVDIEPGHAATTAEDAEAPAERVASPPLEAKRPLPKTFSIPVSPIIPAEEEASDRARRKAKKHKKEHKPKRNRPSHSQDAEAGKGLEVADAVAGSGGAHATSDQPMDQVLATNRGAHLPGAATYDADGRPAIVEKANLATGPSHGASGDSRKQRREGSLFTRALAQAAMRDSSAAARDNRRQAPDGSALIEPAAELAVVLEDATEQQYQGGKEVQEEAWGGQEWPAEVTPVKHRRHRHSRRDRAAAEGSVDGVAEEREASAERRERKEHKEHKRKHKHKHSKRKHQEA